MSILAIFMIIGLAGVGAQWLAWRWQMPAIVLMLVAGILVGPVLGIIEPKAAFGDLLQPIVAIAVALILFEGGMSLSFSSLRDASTAVHRLVIFGGPLVWVLASLGGHYIGGLSWASATIFGGILVVTGPTVIIPLLRQAGLKRRPSEVLRWEAIVNDPIGALAAVMAFEVVLVLTSHHALADVIGQLLAGFLVAGFIGYLGAQIIIAGFARGYVPEYLKVPVLIISVIVAYGIPDFVLHESGLLSVTIMGMLIGNAHLPSLGEIRRFKEHVTVILVSGVFVLLAAGLEFSALAKLDIRAYAFVFAVIFLIRPVAILISLLGSNLDLRERIMIGWIGPRGVVAVAVSGLFGLRLSEIGIEDGALLAPLAFVVVAATVFVHGFSIAPLARIMGLNSSAKKGVIFVGSNPLVKALADQLKSHEFPVLVAERNWFRLRDFRANSIPVYYGEILSETAEHSIDFNMYGSLMALTDNDDYNALICADFAPEFGRYHVFQFAAHRQVPEGRTLPQTLGGRYLQSALSYEDVLEAFANNGRIASTKLSEEFGLAEYFEQNPNAVPLLAITARDNLHIFRNNEEVQLGAGARLISLLPPKSNAEERAEL